jgi:hypothetical protein
VSAGGGRETNLEEGARVNTELITTNLSHFILVERPPADRHPAEVYLARRAPRSRDATRAALDAIAALITAGRGTAQTLGWHLLRHEHLAVIRTALSEHYADTANRMLVALRGVLKECRRLGLMAAEDYRRALDPTALGAPSVSGRARARGDLRSVFEACGEDGSQAPGRAGAVRTLLYGNGPEPAKAVKEHAAPQTPGIPRGYPVAMDLQPRRAAPREVIAHALWEADVCLRQRAFCACLAMLRKALELWSADYRDRYGLSFDRGVGERDDLYWRLTKIAGENKLCAATIHTILATIREDTPDGPHGLVICRGGYASIQDDFAATRLKDAYRHLHELVVTLVTAAAPQLPP